MQTTYTALTHLYMIKTITNIENQTNNSTRTHNHIELYRPKLHCKIPMGGGTVTNLAAGAGLRPFDPYPKPVMYVLRQKPRSPRGSLEAAKVLHRPRRLALVLPRSRSML